MELTRVYDPTDLERFKRERDQANQQWQAILAAQGVPSTLIAAFAKQICDEVVPMPKLAGVDVVHTGAQAEQHFSTSLVTEFIKLGIMEIQDDQLILHAASADLHYTVLREPGRWCLHCGEKLPDDPNGELARLHVVMEHKDAPSPSQNHPAGYEWLTYFECVLDASEHARYKKAV